MCVVVGYEEKAPVHEQRSSEQRRGPLHLPPRPETRRDVSVQLRPTTCLSFLRVWLGEEEERGERCVASFMRVWMAMRAAGEGGLACGTSAFVCV